MKTFKREADEMRDTTPLAQQTKVRGNPNFDFKQT